MSRLLASLIIAGGFLLAAAEADAQRLIRTQGPPLRQACFGDYVRLCRGVPPGGGRILLCLNTHADELSQTCFQALALRGLAYAGVLKTCRPDYERFCSQVMPGWGRGLECMLGHAPSLSPPCRDALAKEGFLDDGRDGMP
jgi:hypothetical protein